MSAGEKRPWAEVMPIAVRLANELAVVCTRIKVAGSLRRRRPEVGDIEFVVEAREVPVDLMGTVGPDLDGIRAIVHSWGNVVKGGDRFIQVQLPDGFVVEVAIAEADRWGSILAIRTGPRDLGVEVMNRLKKRGLHHQGGHVRNADGEIVPTPDEETYFALAGLPCLPPEERDDPKALKPIPKPRARKSATTTAAAAAPEPAEPAAAQTAVPTQAAAATQGALLLVDGSNLAARAYHTMREPTLAELPSRFRYLLESAIGRWQPAHLIVALDGESFRRRTIPGYKADRADRDGPSTRAMTEVLRPALSAWGVATREAGEMEADDVIATLTASAVKRGMPVLILTKDSDLLQLVSDADQVRVLWPGQKDGELAMDEAAVAEFLAGHRDFGHAFPPARILDLRVLAGGKDGLPRVEVRGEGLKAPFGFTTKRAAELLAAGATLASLDAEHQVLLKDRERTWWAACRDTALARADELRLRTQCDLIANDAQTGVATVKLSRPITSVVTAAAKRMARCVDCEREIPYDPVYDGNDRCSACAMAWGRLEAARLAAGQPRACSQCHGPLDAGAVLYGEGRGGQGDGALLLCSTCALRAKVGRAPAAA